MNKFETTINGTEVSVDNILRGYELHQKTSSNVSFFGVNKASKSLFIQFSNGAGFIYSDVPETTLDKAVESPSIGKFYHSDIKNQFETEKTIDNVIEPIVEDEDDDDFLVDENSYNW